MVVLIYFLFLTSRQQNHNNLHLALASELQVFPPLVLAETPSTWLPALDITCIFSLAWHRLHLFLPDLFRKTKGIDNGFPRPLYVKSQPKVFSQSELTKFARLFKLSH